MEFRNPFKSKIEHLLSKEAEYQIYKKAADDIEADIIDKGIWTKAFALAGGDEKKQKVFYIELIVEHYKDLIKAGEELETILKTESEKKKEAKKKEEDNLKQASEAEDKKDKQENLSEKEKANNKEKELFKKEAKEQESSDLLAMGIFVGLIITFVVANL
jgi:hypothetical protein